MKYFISVIMFSVLVFAQCEVPKLLKDIVRKSSLKVLQKESLDVRRNLNGLSHLCIYTVTFKEKKYFWKMVQITRGWIIKPIPTSM